MIRIGNPRIEKTSTGIRLVADIEKQEERGTLETSLWYEVSEEYGQYLCDDRIDAFVIGLMRYALVHGHDIVSEAPISQSLHYQLTKMFLPGVVDASVNKLQAIRVTAPITADYIGGSAVLTGCSCGVDNLYVLREHTKDDDVGVRLTHLVVNNMHTDARGDNPEEQKLAFASMVNRAAKVAKELGVKVIAADTNFSGGCFPDMPYEGNTTFAHIFGAYALQKLCAKYILAGEFPVRNFSIKNAEYVDTAYYDLFTVAMMSTPGLAVYSGGGDKSRLEKVKAISDWHIAQKYLNVCHRVGADDLRNCSYNCPKCMYTINELAAVGDIDKFSSVFDIEYYHKHPEQYIAEAIRLWLQRTEFGVELFPYMRKMNWPVIVWGKAWMIVIKKIVKKVLRGGRCSHNFSPR